MPHCVCKGGGQCLAQGCKERSLLIRNSLCLLVCQDANLQGKDLRMAHMAHMAHNIPWLNPAPQRIVGPADSIPPGFTG